MKTAPNPNNSPWATAGALAMVITATVLIGLVYALTGCRTHKDRTLSVSAATTATQNVMATDTARSLTKTDINAISATEGTDREQVRIHIDRDSDGRPSDILVDRSASKRRATTSGAAIGSEEKTTAMHRSDARKEEETQIKETEPEPKGDNSIARMIIAVVFFFLFGWVIATVAGKKKN